MNIINCSGTTIVSAAFAVSLGSFSVVAPVTDLTSLAVYASNHDYSNSINFEPAKYHTPFSIAYDKYILYEYNDIDKYDIINKFVASITTESTPLTNQEQKILSDNFFDLL